MAAENVDGGPGCVGFLMSCCSRSRGIRILSELQLDPAVCMNVVFLVPVKVLQSPPPWSFQSTRTVVVIGCPYAATLSGSTAIAVPIAFNILMTEPRSRC